MSDFSSFQKNFDSGKTQLVCKTISGDLYTPVGAYLNLCGDEPYCFLLESVEGGKTLGRYSIIGMKPDLIWNADKIKGDVLGDLRNVLKSCRIDIAPDNLPPMAVSGLFGYMGYDMVRLIEEIPNENPDDLKIPNTLLIRPSILIIFDNVQNLIYLVAPIYTHAHNCKNSAEKIFENAEAILKNAQESLKNEGAKPQQKSKLTTPLKITSNIKETDYKKSIEKTIDYIHQGEIFQAVIAQRFSADFDLSSMNLYRSLRRLNPSPFLFHLTFEGFSLVGSSPEILVRVRDNTVTIRPIAGTRKRGKDEAEDKELMDDLLSDEKELAEHLMLLDLGRNDVGRVTEFGSVKVTERNKVELYSHVMHIVSNVEGQLRKDKDLLDALFSGFPAGTVSGAPKIRAMEIIDELEISKRGYYGGMAGYLSGNGAMDTCIALRTALVKDGKIYVQAGGGVVADSDPDFEYQESVNKAQALFRAAELAIEASKD